MYYLGGFTDGNPLQYFDHSRMSIHARIGFG